MKILHILNTDKLSGAENVAADICMMFEGEHDTAYCSPEGSIREALSSRGVNFIPIQAIRVAEIKRVIRVFRPDIIHAHDLRASMICAVAAGKIPVISHLHGNGESFQKISVKSVTYLFSAYRAKQIISVSESVMQDYTFRKAVEKKNLHLRNVVYTPRIEKLMAKDERNYSFDFVYMGRIAYPKDPARVARVAAAVLKKHPEATFGVIGDGNKRPEMVQVFEEEGVLSQVEFTGVLPYPYKALSGAKCMLMCSQFEGTPIAALEAMALGIPLVSTPVDGMVSLIKDGESGCLSDSDEKLASTVERIITDPGTFERMSAATVKQFKTLNMADDYKRQLQDIYRDVTRMNPKLQRKNLKLN